MAYTINNTAGTVIATITDGTIDTTTDLTLIGKNYTGYGEIQNENFVKLLENFANTTAPASPQQGQLWWDSSAKLLNVYDGTSFKTVSSSTAQATPPTTGVTGDLWWDTANGQLRVYDGTAWILVGPAYTAGSGTSGAIVEVIRDTTSANHVVVKSYVSDTVVSITSKDAAFTPSVPIPGFSSIKPGINLVNPGTLAGSQFVGTASDADKLGGVAAANYLRSDVADSTAATLSVLTDSGLFVGADRDFSASVVGADVLLRNQTANGDLILRVNVGGTPTNVATVDGATGNLSLNNKRITNVASPVTGNDAANKTYVDTIVSGGTSGLLLADGSVDMAGNFEPDVTNVRNIGTVAKVFANIYATTFHGTSTTAQYADIAERFEADEIYAPGTVVALGGSKEITAVAEPYSESVFGVISTQPAHLMNAAAGNDATHPPIAMSGRVPVRVIGKVSKGDRLISAGNGLAQAGTPETITPYNIIGRSLEEKNTDGEGIVEATVRLNS